VSELPEELDPNKPNDFALWLAGGGIGHLPPGHTVWFRGARTHRSDSAELTRDDIVDPEVLIFDVDPDDRGPSSVYRVQIEKMGHGVAKAWIPDLPGVHVRFDPGEGPALWFGDGKSVYRLDVGRGTVTPDGRDYGSIDYLDERSLRIMKALLDTASRRVDRAIAKRLSE